MPAHPSRVSRRRSLSTVGSPARRGYRWRAEFGRPSLGVLCGGCETDLSAFLALRDPARRLLHARLGRGDWLPADVEAVNARLLAAPELTLLGDRPGETVRHPLGTHAAMSRLLAGLAADVRDAAQRPDLTFCDAPGCGLVFYRRRTNQAWCGAPCGNRARVARHQSG